MAGIGRGRAPYWAAVRLAGWLASPGNWNDLDAWLTARGTDLDSLDARRACNAVYAALVDGKDEKEQAEFDRTLEAEPSVTAGRVVPDSRLPSQGGVGGGGTGQLMALMGMPQAGV